MKDQVDPKRFTGKAFTRRKTFRDSKDDYAIKIDRLIAGRIMKMMRPGQRVVWLWSLTAPYFPVSTPQYGEEDTFEAASEAFKKLFWEWHAWAIKQPGKVTWYGAKE